MKSINKKMRSLFLVFSKVISFVVVFFILHGICDRLTEGFWLQKMFSDDIPSSPQWEIPTLSSREQERVERILDQPFYFLGMGSECFTFISEDGRTVLKCFKLDQMRYVYFKQALSKEDHADYAGHFYKSILSKIPLPTYLDAYRKRVIGIRNFRIENTFNSFKIAYENLQHETGLFFLHLNPTSSYFKKKLTIYDKIGVKHTIDLDKVRFALQTKACLVKDTINDFMQKCDEDAAKRCLNSLTQLIIQRCKKGIYDRDPIIKQNFGFIGESALEIDTGSFSFDSSTSSELFFKKELYFETLPLKAWLRKRYPQLALYLEKEVQNILSNEQA